MKFVSAKNVAALGVALLGFGAIANALPGQEPAKPANPSSAMTSESTDQKCANIGVSGEQIEQMLRNSQLEEKLAGLSQRLAKEEAMSSPELAKLQNLSAQLEEKDGQVESRADEMAARAREMVSEVGDRLQQDGAVLFSQDNDAGWLGVEIEEVTPDRAKDLKLPVVRGVIVQQVEADSPAAKAGLKQNDVILEYDGHTVEGTVQFRRLVRETPPGRAVNLEVSRDGATQRLSVQITDRNAYYEKRMRGAMPEFGKSFSFEVPNFNMQMPGAGTFMWMSGGGPALGIEAEDLSGQLGAYFGAPNDAGVLVRSVHTETPASRAGLKAGDVIVKLDGTAVKSVSELRDDLREKRDQKSVTLSVLRRGSEVNLTVQMEHPNQENPRPFQTAVL
ncbi:MAG TPA: PDZ domain-containing protein [Candidatus Acidoferrum sp.]|nr:PDZ domain-containing protein [Candidatus Acidoferrum sp.]